MFIDIGFDDLRACANPGVPEHGYRTPSAGVFFESAVVRLHCQEGYRLKGPSKKLCVRHFNGSLSWKPSDKPVCLQEGKSILFKHFTHISVDHLPTYHYVSMQSAKVWNPFHTIIFNMCFNF